MRERQGEMKNSSGEEGKRDPKEEEMMGKGMKFNGEMCKIKLNKYSLISYRIMSYNIINTAKSDKIS